MLCADDESFLTREGYILERKYDGTRILLFKDGPEVHLVSRKHIEYSELYPELLDEALSIKARNCILDGELAFFTPEGYDIFKPIHTSRQNWMRDGLEFRYMVFDILEKDGENLKNKPLLERKTVLTKTVQQTEHIRLVDFHVDYAPGNGKKLFKEIVDEKGEGVVIKPKQSLYLPGSRGTWGKVKGKKVDTAWVVGFTPGEHSREKYFGSLVLAQLDGTEFVYSGRVGTGFNEMDLISITEILDSLPRTKCPFPYYVCSEGKLSKATWVKPELKIRVSYQEVTEGGKFRGPAFEGIVEN